MRNQSITPELVASYWHYQRKAFLLLQGEKGDPPHEYVQILDDHASQSKITFLESLKTKDLEVRKYQRESDFGKVDVLTELTLKTEDLDATVDILVRRRVEDFKARQPFEPHLVVGKEAIKK